MAKLVTLTLTDGECLTVRMALNAAGIEWGNKAAAARAAGDDVDADTCERLRADHGRLWELVQGAQQAGGRQPDWLARREAGAKTPPDAHIADNFGSHYESSNMQRP